MVALDIRYDTAKLVVLGSICEQNGGILMWVKCKQLPRALVGVRELQMSDIIWAFIAMACPIFMLLQRKQHEFHLN